MKLQEMMKVLSKNGSIELLELLSLDQQRDKDIKKIIPRDGTRRQRINELEDLELITRIPVKINRNFITHYKLTTHGTETLTKLKTI